MCALVVASFAVVLALGVAPAAASTGASTTSDCSCACVCFKGCGCGSNSAGSWCNLSCFVCIGCAPGVTGGGTVQRGDRQVTVALFATVEKVTPNKTFGATGLVRWVDPNLEGTALTLESTGISAYGPVPDQPNTRAVTGYLLVNGRGPYPFRLVVDAEPGSGQDTLALTVGDAVPALSETGFSYSASGPLVSGDLIGTWTPPGQ